MVTADEARERLKYNPKTGLLRWKISPANNVKAGDVAGSLHNSTGYIHVRIKGKPYFAHRLAWLITHGEWPPQEIDHINGSPSDNRLINLCCVSHKQNHQNKKCHREGHLPGTTYHKQMKKWFARIRVNGKRKHLGYFATEQFAHEAYLAQTLNYSRVDGCSP